MTNDTARRILVIANETLADTGVVDQVRARAGGGPAHVLVVAPALPSSRLAHLLGTESERDRAAAQARLDDTVEALAAAGLDATGRLGDGEPLQALDDAFRTFGPHEVVISTHVPERSIWLERDVVFRARNRYDVPITHLVVDLGVGLRHVDAPRRRSTAGGDDRVTVFLAAPYEEALAIRERGFRDDDSAGAPGVTVAGAAAEAAAAGGVVLSVEVPAASLEGREVTAADGARRFVLPADMLNRAGPAVTVDDWSE